MSAPERLAARLLATLARIERAVTFAAFMLLVAVLFGDVVLREITGTGMVWARQVAVYANLFLTLVGIGIASADGVHLRPRFADALLPSSWEPFLRLLQQLAMAAFCMAFAVIASAAVAETRLLVERTAMPAWPVWPFQVVIPVVFALAGLRHLAYAVFPRLAPAEVGEEAAPDAPREGAPP